MALEGIAYRILNTNGPDEHLTDPYWRGILVSAYAGAMMADPRDADDGLWPADFQRGLDEVRSLGLRCQQGVSPCQPNWWGSKEQLVYLQVLAVMLGFEGHPYALVVVSAGPMNSAGVRRLQKACGHSEALLIEAYIQAWAWCKKWYDTIPDIKTKVNARVAGRSLGSVMQRWHVRNALAKARSLI